METLLAPGTVRPAALPTVDNLAARDRAAEESMRVDVRVLGPVEVRLDGPTVDVGSPKQRTVLALLAAAAPRLVSVDRLIDEVWEGRPPPRPLGSLQAYVSHLRRVLEPGRRPGSPATVLVTAPPGYALRVRDELDRIRFEQAAGRGHDLLAAGEAAPARRCSTTTGCCRSSRRSSPCRTGRPG